MPLEFGVCIFAFLNKKKEKEKNSSSALMAIVSVPDFSSLVRYVCCVLRIHISTVFVEFFMYDFLSIVVRLKIISHNSLQQTQCEVSFIVDEFIVIFPKKKNNIKLDEREIYTMVTITTERQGKYDAYHCAHNNE